MKKILFLLLCIFMVLSNEALSNDNNPPRRTIKGQVVDERGDGLPGASVHVKGTTIGAGTNAKGEFTIITKENNPQTLMVSFTGYSTAECSVKVGNNTGIRVQLKPSDNPLEEVVVTGTRTAKPLKDVPVLTRVISTDDIQRINPISVQKLLEYSLPGIQFGRHHGSGLPTLTFQGSQGNYMLFLVDGERVAGEGASENMDFDRFNIDDIERIEIIKGSMSTLYGSNALGGVVNIITKNANRPFTGNVSARYGNKGEEKYSGSIGTKQSRFSSLTSVSYKKKDDYTVKNDDGSDALGMKGYEIWQGNQKFGYSFTDKLKLNINASAYQNRRIDPDKSLKRQTLIRDFVINPHLYYSLNENHSFDLSYSLDDYNNYKQSKGGGDKEKESGNILHIARLNYTGRLSESHTLTAGAEFNSEKLKHNMLADMEYHKAETSVFYLQEDWRVFENFNIVTGLRGDYHSKYNLNVTPKVSLMYKLGILSLRGGYSMGFRSPSLKELYMEYDMGGLGWFTIKGNENLKPEKSHQFTASAEVTKGIFNGSVSGYYNRFRNKITSVADNDGTDNTTYQNADKAKTAGVDVIGQLRFGFGLDVQGSYSYVNDYKEREGKNYSTVRPHSVTVSMDYMRKFGKIETFIAMNGRWMSSVNTWSKSADTGAWTKTKYNSRTICSLNTGAQLPRGIRLNVGLDNLLNFKDKNVSDTSISPEQGITFVTTLSINIADMFKL